MKTIDIVERAITELRSSVRSEIVDHPESMSSDKHLAYVNAISALVLLQVELLGGDAPRCVDAQTTLDALAGLTSHPNSGK